MRVSRTPLRVRSTLHPLTAPPHSLSVLGLGLTIGAVTLAATPALGFGSAASGTVPIEPAPSGAGDAESAVSPTAGLRSVTGGAVASAALRSSTDVRSTAAAALSVEAVEPRIEDVAVPALTAARRADLTPGLERVEESDTPLVAHVMRTGLPQFSMAGVTWDQGERVGEVTAQIRVFDDTGWSEWTLLPAPDDEGPSITEEPDARAGTFPAWVGNATGIEVAVFTGNGTVPHNVEVSAIDPGTSPYDGLMLSAPSAAQEQAEAQKFGPLAGTFPGLPRVITRDEWGADESLGDKCWSPRLGTTFKAIFVHHTAGSNDYSEYESPALVRGIYAYHVLSRGWCDIGYNFLVDRYGNVFEGRSGGIRLPVRGAHSGDYNLNSTGISAMGNFDQIRPPRPLRHALVALISWRLGTAYHGAFGRISLEGDKFARISGHRDAMSTSCPGRYIYDWLPTLRERVRTRLGGFVSPIEAKWRTGGGSKSRLGMVRIGEQGEFGGHHTAFAEGKMYSSKGGVFSLYRGPVLNRYKKAEGVQGELGYPRSGVFPAGNGIGSGAMFSGGRIYWSEETGSRLLVRSPVLKRYLAEDGPKGSLGFPTTMIVNTPTGHYTEFQHGTITFDKATHQTRITWS